MADAAKPKPKAGAKPGAKPAEGGGASKELEYIFWIVLILFLLSFLPALFGITNSADAVNQLGNDLYASVPTLGSIALFLTLLFGMALIYVKHLDSELGNKALKALEPLPKKESAASSASSPLGTPNERWSNVLNHISSSIESDWRLAIIEADIMLEDMLRKMGYQGVGIGDMLKNVERSDFNTLDQAWEAHKVRNAIAHQGGDFVMSHDEAQRTITLYSQVFQEFFYI